MPFAPSVLACEVEEYFVNDVDIPFMSEVLYVRESERSKIVGALNVDGSARVHTVRRERNRKFFDLIYQFFRLTSIPMLLNTSFNGAGEPIVETTEDALNCFFDLQLDCLVIEDVLIVKKDLEKWRKDKISLSIGGENLGNVSLFDILPKYRTSMNHWAFVPRDRFLLREDFVRWIKEGRKCTTIRYRKSAIEYPLCTEIPLYVTEDFSRTPRGCQEGVLRVNKLLIKAFGDLDHLDAKRDGFTSIEELRNVLRKIYGRIGSSEPVVIYSVHLL